MSKDTNRTVLGPRLVEPRSILIAIPTLNEEQHIESTLDMILAGDPALKEVKVVVADGGSSDRTRELVEAYALRAPNVSLIDNPLRRQAAAVNRVVEICAEAHHTVLVRVDAHAEYPPNYVLDVADSLVEHDAAAVATVMDSLGHNCFQKGAAWAVDTKLGSGGSGHRGGKMSGFVDHGHHAGFRISMWRKTGGYDPHYDANEDAEFDHRLRQSGGRIWLDADIRLGYVMRPTPTSLARQYWRYGRGRARTAFLHGSWPKLRQMVPPLALVACAASLLLAMLWPVFLLVPATYLAVLAGASLMLAVRNRSLCGLWAGPALFAMHMLWGAGFLWHTLTRQDRAA